ncbi:MAG TPA: hypothetical protein VHB48_08490 [Chitinophagaceae bacterium]|nr:hypothetical protein [Chitinophagaceae bacterium]
MQDDAVANTLAVNEEGNLIEEGDDETSKRKDDETTAEGNAET